MRALILGVVLLAACTATHDGRARPEPPATEPSLTAGPEPYVRSCESSVYGDLGPGWRRGEVSAGPVVFVAARGYANDPRRRFRASGELATAQKVLIVVEGDRPVVVTVRHPDAALFYDPERWGDRNDPRFDAGDPRVRFEPAAAISAPRSSTARSWSAVPAVCRSRCGWRAWVPRSRRSRSAPAPAADLPGWANLAP